MGAKALIAVVLLAALIVAGALAMHGKGHALLVKWMPAIHGGR